MPSKRLTLFQWPHSSADNGFVEVIAYTLDQALSLLALENEPLAKMLGKKEPRTTRLCPMVLSL